MEGMKKNGKNFLFLQLFMLKYDTIKGNVNIILRVVGLG